ncbi:MAG: DUF2065 domain-containing protein [Burkholderiales bacterium]|jgi:hypothetical protein|nr:DUF2065 domain-containing protein [Burkholderiales bacterium]
MGVSLLMAVGLMLVLEGIVPFAAPALWRDAFRRLIALRDGQLRFMGLMSMLIGLLLLWLAA